MKFRRIFPCISRERLCSRTRFCVSVKKTLVKSRLEMIAEIERDEGRELMLQGNDSVSVAMDVEYKTNEVSEKCSSASGSTQQQHKQRATTQTTQEEERGSEGRAGQVEKEQGREERVKGRKGQRGRGQEGRKKEEREAEEGGGELVEKDVTGWTEVTRKKKKMVQIFVKVDGGKTSVMEMEMRDKVDVIVKKIPISDQDVYVTSGGRLLR